MSEIPSPLTFRDAWLLPLICLATVLIMLIGAEVAAQVFWPEEKDNSCVVHDDTLLGFHHRPHCVSRMKAAEGPWYTNRYNECGFRSMASCAPVAPGVRRIAFIGASISGGHLVEYEHTIAASLGQSLTAMCPAPVQIQNLAAAGYTGRKNILRMAEALRLHPQAVILVQTPVDIENQLDDTLPPITDAILAAPPKVAVRVKKIRKVGLMQQASNIVRESRAVVVAQHFMFSDPSVYSPLFMANGDTAVFLKPPFTPIWQARLTRFEELIAALADQAHRAGVPFVLVFVPHQAEIAMETGAPRPPGVDPLAFPRTLEAIALRHGAVFVDASEVLRRQPDPASLYYRVDGHPSGKGQPMIGRSLAEHLANLRPGPFLDCHGSIASASPRKSS
jgi:hypothetical protein